MLDLLMLCSVYVVVGFAVCCFIAAAAGSNCHLCNVLTVQTVHCSDYVAVVSSIQHRFMLLKCSDEDFLGGEGENTRESSHLFR